MTQMGDDGWCYATRGQGDWTERRASELVCSKQQGIKRARARLSPTVCHPFFASTQIITIAYVLYTIAIIITNSSI